MVIYVDLLFIVNFLIDGSLLLLTAWTRKKRVHWWRLLFAAGAGGMYVAVMVVAPLSNSVLYSFGMKIAFSALMVLMAFGKEHPRQFLRTLGAFYVAAIASGGGIFGLYYLLMSSGDLWRYLNRSQTGGMVVGLFFVFTVFVLAAWLYTRVFQSVKQQQTISSYMADVEVSVGEFRFVCRGLIDTGNQLYDPLTRIPVMVVEAEGWKSMLPEPWIRQIREANVDRILSSLGEDEFPWQDRLRLVPYRGVNRGTQFMLAIKPDRVSVSFSDKQVNSSRVLIGFDGGRLSSDGSYQAIVHPALLEA